MIPSATERLRFRPMGSNDLDAMAAMLGDPVVMEFYPAPKTRAESAAWIAWNERNYEEFGFGLWVVETVGSDGSIGQFVGDCGLTWQDVDGTPRLEIGYHVRAAMQGRGYATEAAAACRDLARDAGLADELVAIIHPDNAASRGVASKIGLGDWSPMARDGLIYGRMALTS